jgi:hypothetical protein
VRPFIGASWRIAYNPTLPERYDRHHSKGHGPAPAVEETATFRLVHISDTHGGLVTCAGLPNSAAGGSW